jgi:phosphate-selective porin OprO/OprP
MSRFTFVLLASTLAAGLAAAQPVDPAEPPRAPAPQPGHKGPKVPLELKPGGYVQVDGRRLLNGTETHDILIRRLRARLDGKAGKHFAFGTLVDVASSKVVVNDAWIEGIVAPELQIRAGKGKAQFGLERLQSDSQLTMIERTYPTALSPDRDIGVWLRGDIARGLVHYAFGIVDGVANNAILEAETDNELEYNAHVLVSPFATRKDLGDLAIGGATTFGRTEGTLTNSGLTSVRSAGQLTIVKFPTSATDPAANAVADGYRMRFTVHGYYYRGPGGVLAEYVRDNEPVELANSHTPLHNNAWQVSGMLAVTPGDRPSFKSIKPEHPFDPSKGTYGAVELTARYSQIKLDLAAFDAKILKPATSVQSAREATVGVNWYFNEYVRLQINYSLTTFDSANSTLPPSQHLIAVRFQASI